MLRTGQPQHLSGQRIEKLVELGEIDVIGDLSVDWLGVPLKSEDGRTVGVLVVQSYTADVLYTEQDEELLAFVGQHVGAALSRARAIEETRQRNAELALINSVQEALAGELDLQAIYDAVGDRIRDVFDAQVVDIAMLDEPSGLLHFPYTIERGVRFPDEPIELIGYRKHVMETREPLMIAESTPELAERYGNPFVLSGEPVKSALFVPLVVGGRATGVRLAPEPRSRSRVHASPTSSSWRRSPPASASRSRTRGSSTRPGSATRSSRSSTACRRPSPASSIRRRSTITSATGSRRSSTPRS